MTTKPKAPLTAPAPGDTPGEVVPDDARPKPVSLYGMSADAVLLLLRALKAKGDPVLVEAPVGSGDETVVDGHAYGGARAGAAWHFTSKALAMACRVAGWSKVEHAGPGKVRLS